MIHPAVTLLNAALIERTGGGFLFYEEGVTESVGRAIEAVDRERLAIAEALGLRVLSEPDIGILQGYMLEDNYSTGYSTAPGFLGISAQSQLDNRYLTEDVGYSLVFLADLADQVDVPAPTIQALITLASVVLARDLRAEAARTLATLGLDSMSARTSLRSDRRGQTVAASWPQAPSISRPRVSRTVTDTPQVSRRRTNSRSTGFGEASHSEPGVGFSGIRLTCASGGASSSPSRSARQRLVVDVADHRVLDRVAPPGARGVGVGRGEHLGHLPPGVHRHEGVAQLVVRARAATRRG